MIDIEEGVGVTLVPFHPNCYNGTCFMCFSRTWVDDRGVHGFHVPKSVTSELGFVKLMINWALVNWAWIISPGTCSKQTKSFLPDVSMNTCWEGYVSSDTLETVPNKVYFLTPCLP
jgi:hypothetical protein